MRTISVVNQKGGVGKTTTVINLGAALAKEGKSVLVIDLDPQANTTSGLGIPRQQIALSIYEVLFDPKSAPTAVIDHHTGLKVIPSKPDLAAADLELANELNRERRLAEAIDGFSVDYVLIDCPPSLGLLTINALTAATEVIIPVQAEYYALEGLSQLLNTIQRVRQALNPDLAIGGVLMTMVDERTTLSKQVQDQVETHFQDLVFETFIPRNVRIAEAPSHGQTVQEHDKWSKGARAYKALAKEVITRG